MYSYGILFYSITPCVKRSKQLRPFQQRARIISKHIRVRSNYLSQSGAVGWLSKNENYGSFVKQLMRSALDALKKLW